MLPATETADDVRVSGVEVANFAARTEERKYLPIQASANVEGPGISGTVGHHIALAEVNDSATRHDVRRNRELWCNFELQSGCDEQGGVRRPSVRRLERA